jgi:hypothetical protein
LGRQAQFAPVKLTRPCFFNGVLMLFLFSTVTVGLQQGTADQEHKSPQGAASFDGPAELPRVRMNTAQVYTQALGKNWKVESAADLQSVLNQSRCGDKLLLKPGVEYRGNFQLPAKNCDDNHWIIIRSAARDSDLPPEGMRLTPCYAGVSSLPGRPVFRCNSTAKVVATLMASNTAGPLILASGANHYRIGPGLEITRPIDTGINYGLIIKDASTPADHIIVDRDWVHGTPQDETTRGMFLSGVTYAAVIDSFFNDFHCAAGIGTCIDSQAIAGGSGALPQGIWEIHGNFLEAAAENIMFGGTARNSVTPADITIRHNHLFKPLTWMPRPPQSGYVGARNRTPSGCPRFDPPGSGQCPFIVKNLFELKNAQRLLFEGNVLENAWAGFTQHGQSILIEGANTSANASYSNVSVVDVTIRYNRIAHSYSGFGITNPNGLGVPNLPVGRISVHDDIFDDISDTYADGDNVGGWALELLDCPQCAMMRDISITHVTELLNNEKAFLVVGSSPQNPIQNFIYENNIVTTVPGLAVHGTGPNAPCGFVGHTNLERLESCLKSYVIFNNALIGASEIWPKGNLLLKNVSPDTFVSYNNANAGDYHVSATSRLRGAATDKIDLGADVDAVNNQITTVSP